MTHFLRGLIHLREEKADGGDGGGGAKPDPKDLEISNLKKELEELKAGGKKTEDDPDLKDKARIDREKEEAQLSRDKQLERATRFNMGAKSFVKENESLLPKEFGSILERSEKETYANAIQKDGALKSALVQEFFGLQENVELLTPGQKAMLDDYLKLTKDRKQDKAQELYELVFEPAFETLKRTKRAEALARGHGGGSSSDEAYKKRLIEGSTKHYLRESKNA